jgi:hemolysin III
MLSSMANAPHTPLPYTAAEERWHSLTHVVGLVATAASIPWLLWKAASVESPWRLAGAITFSVAALLMFATSVIYHRSTEPEARQRWRLLDHAAIFLLIAGTYTPFAAGVLGGTAGFALLAVVWAIALGGILAKVLLRFRYPRLSTALYLLLGWVGVAAIKPLWNALDADTLAWIAAGGLCYTLGVPFYVWKSRPYMHVLWHVFVVAGVACHFVAVMTVL